MLLAHGLLAWLLASGTATRLVQAVRPAVEVALIAESPAPPKMPAPPIPPEPTQAARPPPRPTVVAPRSMPVPVQSTANANTRAIPLAAEPLPANPVADAPTGTTGPVAATPAATSPAGPSTTPTTMEANPPPAARPAAQAIAGICPGEQPKPLMPRRAIQEGTGGRVDVLATVRGGRVVEVQIVSARPRGLFESAVKQAVLQYRCESRADEVVAPGVFEFKFDD